MVAIAPRIANAHWRRSISRVAELFGLVGIVSLIIYIPVGVGAAQHGRRKADAVVLRQAAHARPHAGNPRCRSCLLALTVTGLWLLWVSAMPDFAMLRDRSTGTEEALVRPTGAGLGRNIRPVALAEAPARYPGGVLLHDAGDGPLAFSIDFAIALVPGWVDALYPATHAHNSLQAGVAITLIAMFVMYRFGGYKDYITLDQFWGLGKLLFALSLLWFWFWFSSFIIFWFGAKPAEEGSA